ncbi:MAG: ComF family protein [Aestuariibacter sp.]
MQQPNFREQLPQLVGHHLFSIGPHIWPLDHLIATLKYHQKSILVPELAALFAHHFRRSQQALPEAILAVPMHPIKLWLRGFNQSALLAQHIGRELGVPVLSNLARKRWSFTPQVRKTATQRRRLDVSHFDIKRDNCSLSRIAIFDDVITTGSTVASLAKALKLQYPELEIQFWSCSVSLKQK